MKKKAPPQSFRCAIYTRVSTDDGLDQDFNSLDAQREAAEAYVKSQAQEGWRLIRESFDDGGFSGGSMARPALQRLLEVIRSGQVDTIVVYKVDRLTRSLADFAKLVELFEEHNVTFVSVTQSFNTTTSMGRLTLNMLLSFAQFEREVTGERIRDKIAATKKRGIWVGGVIPLGYRVQERKLLIDAAEAGIIRLIFERYLSVGSLPSLQAELRQRGIVTRQRTLATGRTIGGIALTNGPLAHLLRNRVYIGEINHKGASYPGEHEAIIATELFEAAQARLTSNLNGRRAQRVASGALLLGKIYDDRGHRMTPSAARKGPRRYRYYISCLLAQGRAAEAGSVKRVAAPEIETIVIAALRARFGLELDDRTLVVNQLARVVIASDRLELTLADSEVIRIAWVPTPNTGRREIIGAPGAYAARPMKSEARLILLRSIALGRRWLDQIVRGTIGSLDAIAEREGCSRRQVERMIASAFLSPQIVKAAAEGRLPRGVNARALADAPIEWSRQWQVLGLSGL
ncbi:MAG: recombinase family protein [Hyphomicrobiales bacterium]|nr:recombinase family protein [Hyphomicrobiales bacterium]